MEYDTLCLNRLVLVDENYDMFVDSNYIAIIKRDGYFIIPNVKYIFDVVDKVFYLPFQLDNKRVYLSLDDE